MRLHYLVEGKICVFWVKIYLQNDLLGVEWDVKPYTLTHFLSKF